MKPYHRGDAVFCFLRQRRQNDMLSAENIELIGASHVSRIGQGGVLAIPAGIKPVSGGIHKVESVLRLSETGSPESESVFADGERSN